MINHHSALIYTMVLASAADREMTDSEMTRIGQIVQRLPAFEDFNIEELAHVASECATLLNDEDGLDTVLQIVKDALPGRMRETAYAFACDIVAADGSASQEELRLLEMIRHKLDLDRLIAAAIERGARARHARI